MLPLLLFVTRRVYVPVNMVEREDEQLPLVKGTVGRSHQILAHEKHAHLSRLK
jgi:hypothetical protein